MFADGFVLCFWFFFETFSDMVPLRGTNSKTQFKQNKHASKHIIYTKESMFWAYFPDISTFYVFLGQGFTSIGQPLDHFPPITMPFYFKTLSAETVVNASG